MISKARYMMDFRIMPEAIRKGGPDFVKLCLTHGAVHMQNAFNNYFHNMCHDTRVTYNAHNFHVTDHKISGRERILYIELPPSHDDSTVYCTAYAIAYTKTLFGIKNTRFFTIEQTSFGTTCIGTMTADGAHLNFGNAYPTREQNLEAISKLDPDQPRASNQLESENPFAKYATQAADIETSRKPVPENLEREFLSVYLQTRSAPLGDYEDAWNWMIGKMKSFQTRGLEREKIQLLANNLLMYMTPYYVDHVEEFLTVADVSMVIDFIKDQLQNNNHQKAKEIAAPCWDYLCESQRLVDYPKEVVLILALAAKG